MAEERDCIRRVGADSFELAIDLRHAPLYITRWSGRATLDDAAALQAAFTELAEAAEQRGGRIAYVNHVGGLERSSSEVRRRLTEVAAELNRSAHGRASVGSWNIVSNAVIRGTLRMIRWMTSNEGEDHFVASLAEGITEASAALERVGESVEVVAADYSFPSPDAL